MRILRLLLLLGCAATAVAGGCTSAASPPADGRIAPAYDPQTGRLQRIAYDRNQDGKADAWVFMDGTRVVRAELDEDYDDVVDRWEYFEAGAPGNTQASRVARAVTGVLSRVDVAGGADGRVTRREYYDAGTVARAEEDTDADGRVDKWETWTAGVLAAVALDTTGRGTPDRRIVYPQDGSAPRLEIDTDAAHVPRAPAP